MRLLYTTLGIALIAGSIGLPAAQAVDGAAPCPVSANVADRPPDDPHASSFASPTGLWFANERRTVWAWWWRGTASARGYKVLWVRPAGEKLTVTGKRLDGEAPPLTASVPDGYPWTFQASGLTFPTTTGCWQIDATAAGEHLTFVVDLARMQ